MIESKEISIVVQGPIIKKSIYGITNEVTKLICARLKQLFPESELILSTWEGEDTREILYDKLIINKDPGASWFNYYDKQVLNNCNRLITSTLSGIKASTRNYVFKVRSDLFLVSKKFIKYFNKFSLYDEKIKLVKSRILAFSLNSLYGHRTKLFDMHRPFHISDWAYFGYKTDLLNLYDIPLTSEPEFSQWFLNRCKPFFDIEPEKLWKMPPEQYITYSFLKKHLPIELEHTADISNNNKELSSRLLSNNFLILDQTQFSLISLKYLYFVFSSEKGWEWYIFHSDWLNDFCKNIQITSLPKKIKYKFQIVTRSFFYKKFNLYILRGLNGKNHRLCYIIGLLIKYYCKRFHLK